MNCPRSTLYPTLIYFAAATLWVLFSDGLLLRAGLAPQDIAHYQSIKGIGFVLLTSLLLYALLRRHSQQQRRKENALRVSEERLSLALESAQEGLWDWDLRSGEVFFPSATARCSD